DFAFPPLELKDPNHDLPPQGSPRESPDPDADVHLELTANVVDTAGQKQLRKTPVLVTKRPLRIEVIPEAGTLVEGLSNTVYLFVRSADGKPAKARIVIAGMDEEFTTSELGVTSLDVTPGAKGITWNMRATDDKGRIARREVTLACTEIAND